MPYYIEACTYMYVCASYYSGSLEGGSTLGGGMAPLRQPSLEPSGGGRSKVMRDQRDVPLDQSLQDFTQYVHVHNYVCSHGDITCASQKIYM